MNIQEIINWINCELTKVRKSDEMLEDHLKTLLNSYLNKVSCASDFDSYGIDKKHVVENIKDSIEIIMSALDQYSSAHIVGCINTISKYLKDNENLFVLEVKADSQEDQNWYRMRVQERYKRKFFADEMFHIPFELRGKVNTQRYSLPGYPCLYISRSIWATWEEMHEPQLAQFWVSLLKLQENFCVLDLRLRNSDSINKDDMNNILCTLPLVISSSIKVLNPDDNFKPEYIIPQMVMLGIVENQYKINDKDVIGCAYTSTQRNDFFEWKDVSKLDNIALPARNFINKKGLCSSLSSMFEITDSTNYDYEVLKKPFQTLLVNVTGTTFQMNEIQEQNYKDSIFGQLEKRLNEQKLKKLTEERL